jgi:Starch-binding associating with outer membrane
MRTKTTVLWAAIVALAAGSAACNSDALTDLNQNPNAPTQVDPEQLFINGATSAMSTLRGSSFEHGLNSLWVQHYAEVQYPEADLNRPRAATIEGLWNTLYSGPLEDLTTAIAKGQDRPGIWAPALVMRSFVYQEMTDLWGDIPYTEATQGDQGTAAILSPKYDAQAVVYDSLFKALASASTALASAPNAYGATDPIYAGDPGKWQKLANSLRARMAMRLTKVDATRARAELTAALAGPVMTSNADNAAVVWPGGVVTNPLYLNWIDLGGGTRDDQRLSERLVDTMLVTNDPRIAKYAQPTDSSQACPVAGCYPAYVGAPNGVNANTIPLSTASRPTETIREAQSPSFIMRYEEVLFIRAEAAARGWTTENPATLYNAAITASMQFWGVSAADIATYLAQPAVVYNPATALTQIGYQKWVALFNEEIEAYSEWRRFGVPVLTPGPKAAFNTVPRRLTYAGIESSLNKANVTAATTAQGGAGLTNRVWWDKP